VFGRVLEVLDGVEVEVPDGVEVEVVDGVEVEVLDGVEVEVLDGVEVEVLDGVEVDAVVAAVVRPAMRASAIQRSPRLRAQKAMLKMYRRKFHAR
jgi:hypothetical protein